MLWKKKDGSEVRIVKICPMCNTEYDQNNFFCSKDGHRLYLDSENLGDGVPSQCPRCGSRLTENLNSCPVCGYRTHQPERDGRLARLEVEGFGVLYIAGFPVEIGRKELARHPWSSKVNSRHLRISRDGDRYFVQDLKTLNGTSVDGVLINQKGGVRKKEIRDGGVIRIGGSDPEGIRIVFRILERSMWGHV
ncbi:MAG: FHA domain-containing protein [Candidatus Thermoplasmatota archaeon]|jgi:hypothetical protein|nr:FHA domain-containing protein [Candidatus Thermoplasmatota archaeon]MCL5785951.1 FHA domain-containing protein [Candidatus Thermoplasmatota archaeon]